MSPGVELDSITTRMNIRSSLQNGEVEQAIEQVNDMNPEVRADCIRVHTRLYSLGASIPHAARCNTLRGYVGSRRSQPAAFVYKHPTSRDTKGANTLSVPRCDAQRARMPAGSSELDVCVCMCVHCVYITSTCLRMCVCAAYRS